MTARIFQLAVSRGGVPKHAIHEARVTTRGIEGDKAAHPKIHGGPERAVCLFSLELIEALQDQGHPIFPGSTGENVTIRGLGWAALGSGTRLALGDEVIVEITRLADPCKTIRPSFADRDSKRMGEPGHGRLYARVVREGLVRVGQPVAILAAA